MDEQNLDILERIRDAYYQLTAMERRVADYVLSKYVQVQFMSITQLADECGTAEATISRFCRRLKLRGFNAFKIELARYSTAHTPPKPHAENTQEGRRAEIGRLAVKAIEQTIDLMDPERTLQAVEMIERAQRVLCVGSGGSMLQAEECAHLFSGVTNKFYTLSDAHRQLAAVALMDESQLLMLFSYSGATVEGIRALEQAKSLGVPTILITRFNKSPAATLADLVLRCSANEGPFQAGSVPAKVAQLIVIDILFQEYCTRNQESSQENIQRVAAALSRGHV